MDIAAIHTELSSPKSKAITAVGQMAIAAGHHHPLEWLPYYLNLPMRRYTEDEPETKKKADEIVVVMRAFKEFYRGTALDEDDPKVNMNYKDLLLMIEKHYEENSLKFGRQAHDLLCGFAMVIDDDDRPDERLYIID